jgi:hypothetical protein
MVVQLIKKMVDVWVILGVGGLAPGFTGKSFFYLDLGR